MRKNDYMVQQKHKNVVFREKQSLRSYMPSTKVGKNKSSNETYSKLIDLRVDFIGTIFFQLWCEACSFSKICFYENQQICFFLDHIVIFHDFFELKKTRNVIWRRMVHTRARELPYLTIW